MSKAVLISIRPKWCELIASGKKTIEVRKTAPKIETPFKCYIYCTKEGRGVGEIPYRHFYQSEDGPKHFLGGTVIGEFVCDKTEVYDYEYCTHPEIGMDYDCGDNWFCIDDIALKNACMSYEELRAYAGNKDVCGWHISNLVIYDEPIQLRSFMKKPCDFAATCGACRHAKWLGGISFDGCDFEMTHPPQSWC